MQTLSQIGSELRTIFVLLLGAAGAGIFVALLVTVVSPGFLERGSQHDPSEPNPYDIGVLEEPPAFDSAEDILAQAEEATRAYAHELDRERATASLGLTRDDPLMDVLEGYEAVALAQIEAEALDEARATVNVATDLRPEPVLGLTSFYRELIGALIERDALKEAKDAASAIHHHSGQARAYREIAVAKAERGQFEEAKEIAKAIDDVEGEDVYEAQRAGHSGEVRRFSSHGGEHVHAFRRIAIAQAKEGDLEEAKATFALAKEMVEATEFNVFLDSGPQYRQRHYRSLAVAQAEIGLLEEAKETMAAIDWDGGGPMDYLRMAGTLAEIGATEKVLEAVETIDNARHKTAALGDIALAQIEAGDVGEAEDTLAQAIESAQAVDAEELDRFRPFPPPGLVRAYIEMEAFDKAKATVFLLGGPDKDRALAFISEAQAEAGAFQDAKETAAAAENAAVHATVYKTIAAAQAEADDLEAAQAALEEAEEAIADIEAPQSRATSYRELAKIRAETDGLEEAQALLRKAQKAAANMEHARHRWGHYEDIAVAHAEMGAFEDARETAADINDPTRKTQVLLEIGQVKLTAEEAEELEATLIQAPKAVEHIGAPASDKARFYRNIAALQSKAGRSESLAEWYQAVENPYAQINILLGAAKGLLEYPDE